jgi:hypothetical protein
MEIDLTYPDSFPVWLQNTLSISILIVDSVWFFFLVAGSVEMRTNAARLVAWLHWSFS